MCFSVIDCCGAVVRLLQDFCGNAVGLLWDFCGIAVGLLRYCSGINVGFQWHGCGYCCGPSVLFSCRRIIVVLLWHCRGIVVGLP